MTKDTKALREAVEQVKQLAQRDMARTQTDFLGRMGQELCDFEAAIEPYPDGELPDDVRGDAYDAISGLAGLAFAQMLMLRGCDHTIFATPASDVAPVGHWLEPYRTMDAGGSPETAGQVGHSWLIDIARAEHDNDPAALEIDMPRLTEDGTAQILYRGPKVIAACFIVRDPMNFAILFRYLAHPPLAQSVDPVAVTSVAPVHADDCEAMIRPRADCTCCPTPVDPVAGEALAKYAGMDLDERAEAMADNCDGDPWELIGYFREKLRQSRESASDWKSRALAALKGPAA